MSNTYQCIYTTTKDSGIHKNNVILYIITLNTDEPLNDSVKNYFKPIWAGNGTLKFDPQLVANKIVINETINRMKLQYKHNEFFVSFIGQEFNNGLLNEFEG